jgi:hypothetical protein
MIRSPEQKTDVLAHVWKVAPGENAYMWGKCLESGCITVNWLNGRNLNDFATKADIRRALLREPYGHGGAPYIWSFVNQIRPGHLIVANNGLSRVEGIGRVTTEYLHPEHPRNPRKGEPEHRHVRRVNWLVQNPINLGRKLFRQPTIEALDSEQCSIIKRTYLKWHPEYKEILDGLFRISDDSQRDQAEDIEEIKRDHNIGSTTKKSLIDARLGQGRFRKSVLKQWGRRCAVTSSVTERAIRASHIKPWRECTNRERLDPDNGLPLIANLDALFDAGLISFESSGLIVISNELSAAEQKVFSLEGRSLTRPPNAKMAAYLADHRRKHERRLRRPGL